MKNRWLLLLLPITTLLFVSCKNVKQPDFRSIENVRISQFGLKESTLTAEIVYFNPNKFKLKLKEAEGDAWLDSNYLGHFYIDTLIKIHKLSEFRLPVTLKMDMANILQNTSAIFSNKDVMVKIEGKARVGKGLIYISYPIRYQGKQNIGKAMHPF